MADAFDVSIIIVNWNSAALLRACLAGIYSNTKTIRYEILVVDNASFDGCGEMLEKEFPQARFIQNGENGGFARANNLGFRRALGRVVLFLNPDTEIQGEAIERMLQFIDSNADAGVVGARLLNSDRSLQTSCVQRFPTILNQMLDVEFLRRIFPRGSLWGVWPLMERSTGAVAVEVISGACQMIRRELFAQVGMFDEKFFMYAEDTDLCYRVRQAGWKNYCVADASVIHHGGQSSEASSQSNFSAVVMRESLRRFFEKCRGSAWGENYRAAMAAVALCRLTVLICGLGFSFGLYHRQALISALRKWSAVLRWSVGCEAWVNHLAPVAGDPITVGSE